MNDMLYRYQQILTALRDSTDGLTNKQIIEHCKKMRPNEVPNDITSMGLNTQGLRRRELLTTTDTAAGKIHRITDKGLEILAAATGDPLPKAEPQQPLMPHEPDIERALDDDMPENQQEFTVEALSQAYNLTDQAFADPLAEFDKAAAIMRQCIAAALANTETPVKISDKPAKIHLLEKLENMPLLEIWAIELIADIRRDIEQLEGAE